MCKESLLRVTLVLDFLEICRPARPPISFIPSLTFSNPTPSPNLSLSEPQWVNKIFSSVTGDRRERGQQTALIIFFLERRMLGESAGPQRLCQELMQFSWKTRAAYQACLALRDSKHSSFFYLSLSFCFSFHVFFFKRVGVCTTQYKWENVTVGDVSSKKNINQKTHYMPTFSKTVPGCDIKNVYSVSFSFVWFGKAHTFFR